MKRILILLLIFSVFLNLSTKAHPWKPECYIVIDTDCGLDDYRAINLILASTNIRILAIITSNGVVNASDGFLKVKSLLKQNAQEGILVGVNPNSNQKARNCEAAMSFSWAVEAEEGFIEEVQYSEVLNQVFTNCNEKIHFVNMGGLNTLNSYFEKYPRQITQVKEILWTSNYDKMKESFNYLLDSNSVNLIRSKNLPISYLNGTSFGHYSSELNNALGQIDNSVSKNIYRSLSFSGSPFTKMMYDETAVFYLLNKPIFSTRSFSNEAEFYLGQEVNLVPYYLNLINSSLEKQYQVLSFFPMDTADYVSDIQNIMESVLKKYGKDEWAACVITSELHRHIGVYSLIGAKMGIRAKEYFGAGDDELRIVSYAGLEPPFSCLNDGLQVSTGATIGHGLISVDENSKLPSAEFYYLGQQIRISLKEAYRIKIEKEIKELYHIYGLDSNVYWELVRSLAVKYWAKFDRHEVFDIEVK